MSARRPPYPCPFWKEEGQLTCWAGSFRLEGVSAPAPPLRSPLPTEPCGQPAMQLPTGPPRCQLTSWSLLREAELVVQVAQELLDNQVGSAMAGGRKTCWSPNSNPNVPLEPGGSLQEDPKLCGQK